MKDEGSKKKDVMDKKTAEAEFERFADIQDLDIDTGEMDAEDKSTFDNQKRRLLLALMKGSLIINEIGLPVYTPHNSESTFTDPITFHAPGGADFIQMDRKKKNYDITKTHALLASMTKLPETTFLNLKGGDYLMCTAIIGFFMG